MVVVIVVVWAAQVVTAARVARLVAGMVASHNHHNRCRSCRCRTQRQHTHHHRCCRVGSGRYSHTHPADAMEECLVVERPAVVMEVMEGVEVALGRVHP